MRYRYGSSYRTYEPVRSTIGIVHEIRYAIALHHHESSKSSFIVQNCDDGSVGAIIIINAALGYSVFLRDAAVPDAACIDNKDRSVVDFCAGDARSFAIAIVSQEKQHATTNRHGGVVLASPPVHSGLILI